MVTEPATPIAATRPSAPLAAVTGASRGIGRATTLELARRGYRVFALARTGSELQALAAEGKRQHGEIVPVVMDIADDASRQRAVAAITEATDGYGLDVLVNNAGYGQTGPIEEVPVEKVRNQFEVNVFGLLAFTQPFLPGMRARRRGAVVNVSSAAGRISTPFLGVYSASKFALEALSDALRLELAPFGVRVILVEPGPIQTAFDDAAQASEEGSELSPYAPFWRRSTRARSGAQGIFTRPPESVARVIARSLRSKHPRPRYTVTLSARLATIGRRLVPDVVMDWGMRVFMGLRDPGP